MSNPLIYGFLNTRFCDKCDEIKDSSLPWGLKGSCNGLATILMCAYAM